MRKILPFFLLLSLTIACTHHVTIRPDLDVTASIANQLNMRVGLYIPPEVKSLKVSDQATWADEYEFDLGKSVSSMIYKALARVFKSVEILEAYPTEQMMTERNLELVATARITEANIGLNVQEGFPQNNASGNAQITATISFLDSKLVQFTTVNATGTGIGKEGIGLFSSGKDEFSVSVESAVRNLGNNIVQQTYGNYDIRKLADKKNN